MIKEKQKIHLQKPPIGIHKEIIQLAKIENGGHLHIILHFSTNIICLAILSGSFFFGKEELVILNSWAQKFFYNLNDSIKVFYSFSYFFFCWISLHPRLGTTNSLGLHRSWMAPNELIFTIFVCSFPVILDTYLKLWVFFV